MATKPTHNLIRDGVTKCADYVLATVRKKKVLCNVYVDREGSVRIRTANFLRRDAIPRSDRELVGTYKIRGVDVEVICGDLLARLAELPAYMRQEAA